MPVSRQSDGHLLETDMPPLHRAPIARHLPAGLVNVVASSASSASEAAADAPDHLLVRPPGVSQAEFLRRLDAHPMPVTCSPADYAAGTLIPRHMHRKHQLVHAIHGVMVVETPAGRWIVPPSRGLWMPAGTPHSVRAVGALQMRSTYVRPDAAPPSLPAAPQAVGISSLLRELILAASQIVQPYTADSREGRLMRLLLDELQLLPVLPLHLPEPADPRLRRVCAALQARPDDRGTLDDWATGLGVDARTLQRLFARETGMTFGRWRQQARLLGALEQLASGARVIDVAIAFGYDSPSAFATMFKRHFGRTPSAFFE